MKAVVLKTFRDKYTGAAYAPGEVLDIERERFSDIREKLGNSFIAEIVDPNATPAPEEPDSSSAPEQEDDSTPEQEDDGGTSEPEGGEAPATEAPAPPEPPKTKGKKKE